MLFAWQLWANATPDANPPSQSPLALIITLAPIFIIGYFLLMRPMRRQEKERQALLSALKKNDKVVTSGGLIGIVASIKDKEDEVTLKVDESSNVRVRVTKASIVRIASAEDGSKESKEGGA